MAIKRRDFLAGAGGLLAAPAALASAATPQTTEMASGPPGVSADPKSPPGHVFNGSYRGDHLGRIAFPMGGIGAGMICLEGTGALSHVSIRNRPEIFNEPCVFAAIAIKGAQPTARVLEGPVPTRKLFGPAGAAVGSPGATFGLPRFANAAFEARFPFGKVMLTDPLLTLDVEVTGWSPFTPGNADDSSLPVAGLEYRFTNRAGTSVEAVFSFNAKHFLIPEKAPPELQAVRPAPGGFTLWNGAPPDKPWEDAAFAATVSEPDVKVNHSWFRGDCGTP